MAQPVKRPDFGSGPDLTVGEFEPRVGLCADSSEPGACFGFRVSFSLCPSPARTLFFSLSLSQKYINIKKKKQLLFLLIINLTYMPFKSFRTY